MISMPDSRHMAWFHCFAGIAGDMALGSMIDAGADLDTVRELLGRLSVRGWRLEREDALRGGIACTRLRVTVRDEGIIRTHAHIAGLIAEARLPPRVVQRALATFDALARVEGRLHRRPPSQVHFHELGGHDTIIDIVGTAAALEVLEVDEVSASAVSVGSGTVRTAHGLLPNPAPAVVQLLAGAPVRGLDLPFELTTPTGAAILSALAVSYGPVPPMTVVSSGFGAGSRELHELPNCTQVVIGNPASAEAPGEGQPVVELETNVDDATGEQLAVALQSLLGSGALDAWITPAVMKKGRPGHTVHVLAELPAVPTLRRRLRESTGSFGVRATWGTRWPVAREVTVVTVEGEPVRMKVSAERAKPELDDLVGLSVRTGLPIHELQSRAQAAWRAAQATAPDTAAAQPQAKPGATSPGAWYPGGGDSA